VGFTYSEGFPRFDAPLDVRLYRTIILPFALRETSEEYYNLYPHGFQNDDLKDIGFIIKVKCEMLIQILTPLDYVNIIPYRFRINGRDIMPAFVEIANGGGLGRIPWYALCEDIDIYCSGKQVNIDLYRTHKTDMYIYAGLVITYIPDLYFRGR